MHRLPPLSSIKVLQQFILKISGCVLSNKRTASQRVRKQKLHHKKFWKILKTLNTVKVAKPRMRITNTDDDDDQGENEATNADGDDADVAEVWRCTFLSSSVFQFLIFRAQMPTVAMITSMRRVHRVVQCGMQILSTISNLYLCSDYEWDFDVMMRAKKQERRQAHGRRRRGASDIVIGDSDDVVRLFIDNMKMAAAVCLFFLMKSFFCLYRTIERPTKCVSQH
jgi:hypothetical protein